MQTGYITVIHVQSVGICVQFIIYRRHNFTLREVRSACHVTLIKDMHSISIGFPDAFLEVLHSSVILVSIYHYL